MSMMGLTCRILLSDTIFYRKEVTIKMVKAKKEEKGKKTKGIAKKAAPAKKDTKKKK